MIQKAAGYDTNESLFEFDFWDQRNNNYFMVKLKSILFSFIILPGCQVL
jgi:hypothetical protein